MVAVNPIHIVKFEPEDKRLGRHVEHDQRSRMFAAAPRELAPERKDAFWRSTTGPINQGKIGSCTCSSLVQWLNSDFAASIRIALFGRADEYFTQDDALRLYALATRKYDHIPGFYPEEDTGSTGNAAAKAARYLGWLKAWGWTFSFRSLQAMVEKTPVTVGTIWTNTMYNANNGLVTVGSLAESNIAGGHQYLNCGISWKDEMMLYRQSWGDDVDGLKPGGYFAMSFKDAQSLQEADGDVTVPKWS